MMEKKNFHIYLFQALNATEAMNDGLNPPLSYLENSVDVKKSGDFNSIHRTTNKISLICQVVPKVLKSWFKFTTP